MPTKTAPAQKINRATLNKLAGLMEDQLQWSSRITRYLPEGSKELDEIRADSKLFAASGGERFEIEGYRLTHIGAYGEYDSGELNRIVIVSAPPPGEHFPDLLGDLCEDPTGPIGDKASPALRERLDRIRFKFGEYGLIGELPRLTGSKGRREQIRIINHMARTIANGDKELSRRLAQMLADNVENLEPSGEL